MIGVRPSSTATNVNQATASWSAHHLCAVLGSLGAVLALTACASQERQTEKASSPEVPPAQSLEVSPAQSPNLARQAPSGRSTPNVREIRGSLEPANVAGPADSQVEARRPRSVVLPSGAEMAVRPVSTSPQGNLAIPADTNRAGWWDGSSKLGEPYGSTVLVGHVDSFQQGLGKFAELLDAQPGDVITLDAGALSQRFEVVKADLVPKTSLSSESELFDVHGGRRVVLITCGGSYVPGLGGYQDNMVVMALPMAD